MKDKLGIFIQARMGSSRLPGKIFKRIGEKTVLDMLYDSLASTQYKKNVFLLTTTNSRDERVVRFAKKRGIPCFRGSEENVLARFYQATRAYGIEDIVRVTSDCPFLSMEVLRKNIRNYYRKGRPDYYFVKGYPLGIGAAEIFSSKALTQAYQEATSARDKEHVMTYIEGHPEKFRVVIEEAPLAYKRPDIRLTLDQKEDLELLRLVFKKLHHNIAIGRIIELFSKEPELKFINQRVVQKS